MQNLTLANWIYSISPKIRSLSQYEYDLIERVKNQEKFTTKLSDAALKYSMIYIKECIKKQKIDFATLIEKSFSLTREASWRTLQKKHYDVQMLSGVVLCHGGVAEMATGEGKTLTATLPIVLWALYGKGVHVATSNQYLAERDHELMKPVFEMLGLSSNVLKPDDSPENKTKAYSADITYGVGYTFGFDYLRDQLKIINKPRLKLGERFYSYLNGDKKIDYVSLFQRGQHFALIDELDSVLIDEARTPLVLSSKGKIKNEKVYWHADDTANLLKEDEDFLVDEKNRSLEVTEQGMEKITEHIDKEVLSGTKYPWSFYVKQALKAQYLFRKDVDYVVEEGKVMIVDSLSGRKFADRSWNQGLHQAVQAKENVDISEENETLGKITRQKYYALYDTIAGMTGTAKRSERELWELYRLPVATIPTRRGTNRTILPTKIFTSKEQKCKAIVDKIQEISETKQPILVGTKTIEDSEIISNLLNEKNVEHRILNAKHDKKEAEIVEQAGQLGSITIATNMAGRGTDIPLGEGVIEKGGLFVLATERNDSERIDRQLVGRCARQGNPGIAQFFISTKDDLIENNLKKFPASSKDKELDTKYTEIFDSVQRKLEMQHYQQRKQMQQYDNWIDDLLTKVGKK